MRPGVKDPSQLVWVTGEPPAPEENQVILVWYVSETKNNIVNPELEIWSDNGDDEWISDASLSTGTMNHLLMLKKHLLSFNILMEILIIFRKLKK